ncbi:MAG TPA: DUF460 domain-containing protein [Candidatus Nanoarchaeia archaeon]|nr:DUF460 domain-containing protein [Candidatus Nanoarchaeia archaeon]
MGEKKLLIVGVDPGTTLGYGAIDFEGKVVAVHSDKNLDINILISELIKIGKPVIIASDKEHNPDFVNKTAVKLGARLISPDYDLKVVEKRRITSEIETRNQHEIDALASAFFALRKLQPLLNKINIFVEHYKKEAIKSGLIELVVGKGLNIRDAVEILEEPEHKEERIIKEVVAEKKLDENDFLTLYKKYKSAKKDIYLLREHNKRLNEESEKLKKDYEYMLKRISKANGDKKTESCLEFKERRIHILDKQLRERDYQIQAMQNEITTLLYFLANINDNVLLKKLDNLGSVELEKKKALLGVSEGDILLVKDADIYSINAVNEIKGKVGIIVYKKPISKKVEKSLPFFFIDASKLEIDENEYFAITSKESFEKAKGHKGLLDKVISDYQEFRNAS